MQWTVGASQMGSFNTLHSPSLPGIILRPLHFFQEQENELILCKCLFLYCLLVIEVRLRIVRAGNLHLVECGPHQLWGTRTGSPVRPGLHGGPTLQICKYAFLSHGLYVQIGPRILTFIFSNVPFFIWVLTYSK